MASKKEPFYPIHKVQTGLYTAGGEYVLQSDYGTEYIGLYHLLPTGAAWTEAAPGTRTEPLLRPQFNASDTVRLYNKTRQVESNNYISPVNVKPDLVEEDYIQGEIPRYFVQKRNNPVPTIYEISRPQYLSLNSSNNPGINSTIWRNTVITWKLSGDLAVYFNTISIGKAEINFPGIQNYLDNPAEFSR